MLAPADKARWQAERAEALKKEAEQRQAEAEATNQKVGVYLCRLLFNAAQCMHGRQQFCPVHGALLYAVCSTRPRHAGGYLSTLSIGPCPSSTPSSCCTAVNPPSPPQARLALYQEALSELVMFKSKIDVALLQVRKRGVGEGD
jgi:hypothetical protein